jgi:acetylornithine/N-succinyldiaminopimelate aminotransferase
MSHLFPTYQRWDVEPVMASGSKIIDKAGKEYLDLTSGIGVCNLGHCHPKVKEAVEEQLGQFWHLSNLFIQEGQEKAAGMLAKAAEMDVVFFANSGAEANEAAIKLAKKATNRDKLITFEQSFHGRTYATMSATGQEKVKKGFGSMLPTFITVPFNDIEALQKEMNDDVAAIMLEVVQGEGGVHQANHNFLLQVQDLCKQYGALLIIDEIQTGIGRTGKPFSFQHFGLKPDIISVAKGLGSGFPIGAIIAKEELRSVFGPGSHGSTFGGNPISIAAAIATMDIIFQQAFMETVLVKSKWFIEEIKSTLQDNKLVKEVRGLGMMIGIELTMPNERVLLAMREAGLLVLPAGEKVIRLLPPLTATKEDLTKGINMLSKILIDQKSTTVIG